MNWWLPPQASTFAPRIDTMFTVILVLTGIAFVLVEVGLIVFLVKYRGRPGRKAFYTHGSTPAEVIWTAVPAIAMVILGITSNGLWVEIKGRHSVPADAYPLAIHAKQFEWWITYPGPDGKLGDDDDFKLRNKLYIPAGRPIVVTLTSEDVIHSFYIPQFRIRQDVVPGMEIRVWFVATTPGQYEIACSQLCGMGHYKMRAQVVVQTQADYDAWVQQQEAQAKGAPTS